MQFNEETLESLFPGFRAYKKREEAALRTIRSTSYDDDPADQPFIESPRLDAYLDRVQKAYNRLPESLAWDHVFNIAQAEGDDVVEKLIQFKGMDPEDFRGNEGELDLNKIQRHLEMHPVLWLLNQKEVSKGLNRLRKIIEIISLIEANLLDNENPTTSDEEGDAEREALAVYIINHRKRWKEKAQSAKEESLVDAKEIEKMLENVRIFDTFFDKIVAV